MVRSVMTTLSKASKWAAAAALAAVGMVAETQAGLWPHWRGPAYNGSSTATDLPASFGKTQNVRWITEMPGPSAATPILWGNHVFVNSGDEQRQGLVAMALDRQTGRVLWKHDVAPQYRRDRRVNYAAPSPVTDGRVVIFYYGTGDLVAFDFNGRKLWSRNIQRDYGPFAFLWTYSTSPTLYRGRLYIQVLQRDVPVNGRGFADRPNHSYLLALDPMSGKELWKQIRPSKARQESREAFTTPIPYEAGDHAELLVAGGDCLTGHDPDTGRELWRWGTWNPTRIGHWRLVPSPVAGGGVALVCAPKGSPVYAVRLGGRGDLGAQGLAWRSQDRDISSDVSTPLFYRGRFYVMNSDRRVLSCVKPDGEVVWKERLPSETKIEASPTAADGKIYVISHGGQVFVVAAGDQYKLLATIEMGDDADREVRASIPLADGELYIRTDHKLYCIGAPVQRAAR